MKIAALVIALLLIGCSSASLLSSNPLGDITQLSVADLEAALVDATAHGDKPAMACYPVLIGVVKGLPSQMPKVEVKGLASAFQAARDLAKQAQSFSGANDPMIQAVNLGCAALFNDAQGDLLRLGIKFRP